MKHTSIKASNWTVIVVCVIICISVLTGCGNKNKTTNEKIQNNFTQAMINNPNNINTDILSSFASDEEYIYYFAPPKPYTETLSFTIGYDENYRNLYRTRIRDNTTEILTEGNEKSSMGGSYLCRCGKYLFFSEGSTIARVDVETGKYEPDYIVINYGQDINRRNRTYYAESEILGIGSINNLLIYCYRTGYSGTSENRCFYTNILDIDTGTTITLDEGICIKEFFSDGKNLYMVQGVQFGGVENIVIISAAQIKNGQKSLDFRHATIPQGRSILYVASNGLLVQNDSGKIGFYEFENTKKLNDFEVWEPTFFIEPSENIQPMFDLDESSYVFFMTDHFAVSYENDCINIYGDNYELQDSTEIEEPYAIGVANGKVFYIGFDDESNFTVITIDRNGEIETTICN